MPATVESWPPGWNGNTMHLNQSVPASPQYETAADDRPQIAMTVYDRLVGADEALSGAITALAAVRGVPPDTKDVGAGPVSIAVLAVHIGELARDVHWMSEEIRAQLGSSLQ